MSIFVGSKHSNSWLTECTSQTLQRINEVTKYPKAAFHHSLVFSEHMGIGINVDQWTQQGIPPTRNVVLLYICVMEIYLFTPSDSFCFIYLLFQYLFLKSFILCSLIFEDFLIIFQKLRLKVVAYFRSQLISWLQSWSST